MRYLFKWLIFSVAAIIAVVAWLAENNPDKAQQNLGKWQAMLPGSIDYNLTFDYSTVFVLALAVMVLSLIPRSAWTKVFWFVGAQKTFRNLSGDINEFLSNINAHLDDPEGGFMAIPRNWASMQSQAISLTRRLDRLNVPHPPPFKPDDVLLEEICQWHEYLPHLKTMAEVGDLKSARQIVIESSTPPASDK